MTTVIKTAKRFSHASHRHFAAKARLRIALSTDTEPVLGNEALAAFALQARRYRPHVVEVIQDLGELQAHYSK